MNKTKKSLLLLSAVHLSVGSMAYAAPAFTWDNGAWRDHVGGAVDPARDGGR
ncbi:MAG: hypothetical protein Q8K36_04450 [Alphaproteobacteria bacterium]|nr:hypothetical protein [Alphaproteobacteria bacterium]